MVFTDMTVRAEGPMLRDLNFIIDCQTTRTLPRMRTSKTCKTRRHVADSTVEVLPSLQRWQCRCTRQSLTISIHRHLLCTSSNLNNQWVLGSYHTGFDSRGGKRQIRHWTNIVTVDCFKFEIQASPPPSYH